MKEVISIIGDHKDGSENRRRCPNRSGHCLDCPVKPGNDGGQGRWMRGRKAEIVFDKRVVLW